MPPEEYGIRLDGAVEISKDVSFSLSDFYGEPSKVSLLSTCAHGVGLTMVIQTPDGDTTYPVSLEPGDDHPDAGIVNLSGSFPTVGETQTTWVRTVTISLDQGTCTIDELLFWEALDDLSFGPRKLL